ncbi:MAG: hypothetical protein PHU21_11880 [Elusimicrobia bacterium]|nr:hypothetical protein [Elusimicrobiota bacterium]
MSDQDQPPPRKTPALRFAAHVLYLPLIAVLCYLIVLFLVMLVQGKPGGARFLLYGAMLFFIGRRYARIYRGEIDGPQLWKDVAALGVIDFMLVVLWLDYFS